MLRAKTKRQIGRETERIVTSWIDERRKVVKAFGGSDSLRRVLHLSNNSQREGA